MLNYLNSCVKPYLIFKLEHIFKNICKNFHFKEKLLVYAALDGEGSSWSACKELYFNPKYDVRSVYGAPLWSRNLSGLPTTFNILGEFEISRAEEELFIRKLKDNGIVTKSFINEGVGDDVANWSSVTTETSAHIKAIDFIKTGFNID